MQMKRVYSIERLCLGCGLCTVACTTAHSKTGDTVKAYKYEDPRPVSRIRVEGDNLDSIAVQCRHCDDPHCVAACITGAMTKDAETGLVSVDADRCIGCLTCVVACPFGCVDPGASGTGAAAGNAVAKCDLCVRRANGADGAPACVEACPNRALVFAEEAPAEFAAAAMAGATADCEVRC